MRNKLLILFIVFLSCKKVNFTSKNNYVVCNEFEGVWYCVNANIDSLVIKYSHSINDTTYYTSNHPEVKIKHECPYKWKSDNLYLTYNGFTYEFRH